MVTSIAADTTAALSHAGFILIGLLRGGDCETSVALMWYAVLLVLFRRAHLAQNWRVVVFTASFTVAKY